LNPSEVTFIVSTDIYYDLLEDPLFQTVDKIGSQATLLTGQIGSIANSPVLVSAEMPAKAAGTASGSTNIGAVAVNTGNFIVGNQRGLRMDTQDLVESQQKVLVASLRTGMQQLTTNLGGAVSTFRWTA
jgi:N4-gp56 family major capsid protein